MDYKITLILLIAAAAAYSISKSSEPGLHDELAKCLTAKGASMAGTDWCPSCREQKKLFGNSFKYIDYHNCDNERSWCRDNAVRGYPTWILPEAGKIEGVKSPRSLATLTGCGI